MQTSETKLRSAIVRFRREYRDYLKLVRHPANGFQSATLPFAGGFELSIWLP